MKWVYSALTALLSGVVLTSTASAGPITWGYSSAGYQQGNYSFTGSSLPLWESYAGHIQPIDVIGSFSSPYMLSPFPVEGPSFISRVTLTDQESGESGWIDVPVRFFDNETAPEGEWDRHIAGLGAFSPRRLDLGRNRYTVSGDSERAYVEVRPAVAVPEPATLILAGVGLAAVGWRRWSRRKGDAELHHPRR